MVNAKDYFQDGVKLHGHKCPAMPLGLRAGAAAMNKLGIQRTGDSEWLALVELGDHHFATCFADGVQMITGCTFGKGNIRKLGYGKWGLTLIDKKRGKAVRVVPRAKAIQANQQTDFFQKYRMKGVPPTQVPPEVVEPLVEKVLNAPEEQLLQVGEVFDYTPQEPPVSFRSFVCEECGEMVVETYGRFKQEKKVCIPCAEK
jgi:formylmethanofuran dehydrogenase subunit E